MKKEFKSLLNELLSLTSKREFLMRVHSLDSITASELARSDKFCSKVNSCLKIPCWQCKHIANTHRDENGLSQCWEVGCTCKQFFENSLEYLEMKYEESHV